MHKKKYFWGFKRVKPCQSYLVPFIFRCPFITQEHFFLSVQVTSTSYVYFKMSPDSFRHKKLTFLRVKTEKIMCERVWQNKIYKTDDYPTLKRNLCSLDDQSKSLPYVIYIYILFFLRGSVYDSVVDES